MLMDIAIIALFLQALDILFLAWKYGKLRRAVHKFCSQKLDDLCWIDIYTLADAAGIAHPDLATLPKEQMMRNCETYIDCLRGCPADHASALMLYRRMGDKITRLRDLIQAHPEWTVLDIGVIAPFLRNPRADNPVNDDINTALAVTNYANLRGWKASWRVKRKDGVIESADYAHPRDVPATAHDTVIVYRITGRS